MVLEAAQGLLVALDGTKVVLVGLLGENSSTEPMISDFQPTQLLFDLTWRCLDDLPQVFFYFHAKLLENRLTIINQDRSHATLVSVGIDMGLLVLGLVLQPYRQIVF